MVNPVHGSSPIPPGDHSFGTPPPQLYNLMITLWMTFHGFDKNDPSSTANNVQFFSLFQAAIAPIMAYCNNSNNQPLDPYTQLVYNALTAPVDPFPSSLAKICSDNNFWEWNTFFSSGTTTGVGAQLNVVFNDFYGNGCNNTNWFYAAYPGGSSTYPPSTPPSGTSIDYTLFLADLGTWSEDAPGSTSFNSDGNTVINDILDLYNSLESASKAGTLDGYGQFLLNFLTVPFNQSTDSKGQSDTIYSLASVIQSDGGIGSGGNPLDVAQLWSSLFYSEGGAPSAYSSLTSWMQTILDKWEF